MLKQGFRAIAAANAIGEQTIDLYAHILLAMLIEVAFLTSRSPDPDAAAREAMTAIDALLAGWVASPERKPLCRAKP
jgi:hypothetical protein